MAMARWISINSTAAAFTAASAASIIAAIEKDSLMPSACSSGTCAREPDRRHLAHSLVRWTLQLEDSPSAASRTFAPVNSTLPLT